MAESERLKGELKALVEGVNVSYARISQILTELELEQGQGTSRPLTVPAVLPVPKAPSFPLGACLTMTAEQVATVLGFHVTTVYRSPELRAMSRKVGTRVFWLREEFDRWLANRPSNPAEGV